MASAQRWRSAISEFSGQQSAFRFRGLAFSLFVIMPIFRAFVEVLSGPLAKKTRKFPGGRSS
jgi:hypothetical protein